MSDSNKGQTPAPKVSSKSKTEDNVSPENSVLKKKMNEAEKGAAQKTSATKTPQKIQDGDTTKRKREY